MIKKLSLAVLTAMVFSCVACLQADEKAATTVMGKKLSTVKLQLVDGKNFKESKLSKEPEYYILYFSASW